MQFSTFFWTRFARLTGSSVTHGTSSPSPAVAPLFRAMKVGVCVGVLATLNLVAAENPLPADLIITNARVITVNSTFTIATALAVGGDKLLAVGRDRQMYPFKGPATKVIDADGKVILPGLYDGQVHSYQAALSEFDAPLPVLTSIADAQDYIREQVTNKPPGSWIVLERLYPTRMKEGRLPTLKELDAAAPDNPVYWNSGTISVVNSKAMQLSKITKETFDPPGGQIVKDFKTQNPTGLLRNAGQLLKIPKCTNAPSHQEQRDLVKHLYQLYNEQGITSIAEGNAENGTIDLFRELRDDGQLTVRVNCTRVLELGKSVEESIARLDAVTNAAKGKLAYGPSGVGDEWVRIGPLKTIMDGDVTIGTAYLRTPYGIGSTYQITEPADRGNLYTDPEILPDVYLEAARRGWQLTAHCVGDAAMDSLLNVYQYIQFRTNITASRFLITQPDFQTAQNWAKCEHLGVGAELQPIWLYKDGFSLTKTLGASRMKWFMPLKTWFEKGIVVGGGSDHIAKLDSHASTNPWNPWLGIWITLTRQTEQGTCVNPEEALTREQAVRFYTINNARLNFEDKIKGSLEPGKYADFIMIDRDILKCPVEDVKDTKVLLTMVGGKTVWEAH